MKIDKWVGQLNTEVMTFTCYLSGRVDEWDIAQNICGQLTKVILPYSLPYL